MAYDKTLSELLCFSVGPAVYAEGSALDGESRDGYHLLTLIDGDNNAFAVSVSRNDVRQIAWKLLDQIGEGYLGKHAIDRMDAERAERASRMAERALAAPADSQGEGR